jgi:sporulation related protein
VTMPMDASNPSDERAADDALVEEGMRIGAGLETANLVLVLGDEPRRTALAALGIARAQARHRRVALGDLLGDAEPIQQLLDGGDTHGLADSFVYGVSLNKIARPVPQFGDLYVLPSGSEVPAYEEIFTNARWTRLAAGFRETGALLVVAAPASAAHVADVVGLADGVVIVGNVEPLGVETAKVLARIATSAPTPEPEPTADVRVVGPEAEPNEPLPETEERLSRLPTRSRAMVLGIGLAVVLAAVGIWLAARPLASGHDPLWLRRRRTADAAGTMPARLDSLSGDSAGRSRDSTALAPANVADSAVASAYSIIIARFNTLTGAQAWLQSQARDLPSPTFTPVRIQGETWYAALAGSYPLRAQADSLLRALTAQGLSRADSTNIVRAPFAFLVDSVNADAVSGMLKYFADRGQPVYALRQPNGSARLYAGAFESPAQAALYVDAIRTSGIRPVLVYRIGRVY